MWSSNPRVTVFRRFCHNSASGRNNIVPHLLRSSDHDLYALPVYVRI